MRVGLTASFTGHALVVFWGVLATPVFFNDEPEPIENILVELVPITDVSTMRLGSKEAEENLEKAAPEKSEEITENPVDEPNDTNAQMNTLTEAAWEAKPEVAEPLVTPEPEEEIVEAEPEPSEPEPVPEEIAELPKEPEPTVLPKPKVELKTVRNDSETNDDESTDKNYNINDVAALLNKVDPTGGSDAISDAKASVGEFNEQEERPLTQSEKNVLMNHIKGCWRILSGAKDASSVKVNAKIQLDRTGTVTNFELLDRRNDQFYSAAAIRAKSATYKCEPYDMLPVEKYQHWHTIKITFDPKTLVSG